MATSVWQPTAGDCLQEDTYTDTQDKPCKKFLALTVPQGRELLLMTADGMVEGAMQHRNSRVKAVGRSVLSGYFSLGLTLQRNYQLTAPTFNSLSEWWQPVNDTPYSVVPPLFPPKHIC